MHESPPDEYTRVPSDEASPSNEWETESNIRTPLFQANNTARYQRQTIIKHIQARTGRRLISYISGNECIINDNDTMPFVDLLYNVEPRSSLDLLLHTQGGSIDSAEKLVRMVRSKVGEAEFRVVVPEFAKSAGTLLVLGSDRVVMSDMSELGPIDPQMVFADSNGLRRWQPVQNYLDAYDEYTSSVNANPDNVAAQIMLGKLDPPTVKLCRAIRDRARQCAEDLLRHGMFRETGNWSQTVAELLDTRRWISHSQMISWQDAQHPDTIGLVVEHLDQQSEEWQEYWQLYCLQRLATGNHQKLYESDIASLVIDDPAL